MKYIITEHQYRLLESEDNILKLPFSAFGNDWNLLQKFIKRKGNPPYELRGFLDFRNHNIESLGSLTRVDGSLSLAFTSTEFLGDLKYVSGFLDLYNALIESLDNLEYVGGDLNLRGTYVDSLENLKYVGGYLDISNTKIKSLGKLKYVGEHLYLDHTPLVNDSDEEIRSKVKIVGDIVG